MSNVKCKKPRRVIIKENRENPIHETDALAELVMASALILLVSELPDSLSTNTITPTGALSHEWKNQEIPFTVHRMQFILAAVTHVTVYLGSSFKTPQTKSSTL